jgi:predicted RND superfamily exporter protein
MWGLSLFTAIMLIGLGIAIGIYIASQISESIESNRRHKEFIKNIEEYDKKKIKLKTNK